MEGLPPIADTGHMCTCRRGPKFPSNGHINSSKSSNIAATPPNAIAHGCNVIVRPCEGDDVPMLDVCAADDDHCHPPKHSQFSNRTARNKLMIASAVCFLFMAAELTGGILSGSLAIMTDAAHLLSDLAGFIISLFALWVARKPATTRMSFGFYRAEILGAVISVLIIWALTLVLIYLAVMRCIHMDYDIDADIMLITASCGVVINIVLILTLQFVGQAHGSGHSHSFLSGGHSHSKDDEGRHSSKKNLNVQAAFIHCIGDLLQSIGVLVAAFIIKFKPEYKLADPICTFLFSVIVIFTTMSILKDAVVILMEGVPRNVDYKIVRKELEKINGVRMVHSLHVWSLTTSCSAMAVHLAVEPGTETQSVLSNASDLVCRKFGFSFTTIQVEHYIEDTMSSCIRCVGPC